MGKSKYAISYTFKDPGPSGFHSKTFTTEEEADKWVKENEDSLYWHQIIEIDAKSKKPKPIILNGPPTEGYAKKHGTLQTHFETGMECLGLVFYEDGVHGGPNPDFDPSKPEDRNNFKYFASYDGLTFLETGHIIQFADGQMVGLVKDRDFAKRDGYRLSFYPQGFSRKELLELFMPENVKVTLWSKIK